MWGIFSGFDRAHPLDVRWGGSSLECEAPYIIPFPPPDAPPPTPNHLESYRCLPQTSTKTSPLRHLINILSDAVARIDEKFASANLEFPTLNIPFDEKDPACRLLSDPDVVPLSSVIVAAADQLIVSARHRCKLFSIWHSS